MSSHFSSGGIRCDAFLLAAAAMPFHQGHRRRVFHQLTRPPNTQEPQHGNIAEYLVVTFHIIACVLVLVGSGFLLDWEAGGLHWIGDWLFVPASALYTALNLLNLIEFLVQRRGSIRAMSGPLWRELLELGAFLVSSIFFLVGCIFSAPPLSPWEPDSKREDT